LLKLKLNRMGDLLQVEQNCLHFPLVTFIQNKLLIVVGWMDLIRCYAPLQEDCFSFCGWFSAEVPAREAAVADVANRAAEEPAGTFVMFPYRYSCPAICIFEKMTF
jgi:hypothetical protein